MNNNYKYTSNNEVVDAVGTMNFSGNIIPHAWYKTILRDNGKPYLLAITLLADIVYWYRPTEIRNEITGELIGYKKKFRGEMLQRSYEQFANLFGESKRAVTDAIKRLEKIGVIERKFETVEYESTTLNNVLFIKLYPNKLKELTYPAEEKYKTSEMPKNQNNETPITEFSERVLQNIETGITEFVGTNTKNTKKNISNNQSINQDNINIPDNKSSANKKKIIQQMIPKVVAENISLDSLYNDFPVNKKQIQEIYMTICDVILSEKKCVKVNGSDISIQLVKSRFYKLNRGHIVYVMTCLENNHTRITNIRGYLITALYNAPATMNNYYVGKVNADMVNEEVAEI